MRAADKGGAANGLEAGQMATNHKRKATPARAKT